MQNRKQILRVKEEICDLYVMLNCVRRIVWDSFGVFCGLHVTVYIRWNGTTLYNDKNI